MQESLMWIGLRLSVFVQLFNLINREKINLNENYYSIFPQKKIIKPPPLSTTAQEKVAYVFIL
jgi:hypothetical protein